MKQGKKPKTLDHRMPNFFDYDPKTGRLPGESYCVPEQALDVATDATNERFQMSELDRCMARLLSPENVTYLPASFDKRFAGAMAGLASHPDQKITAKQRDLLLFKVVRYRRQLFGKKVAEFIHRASIGRDRAKIEAAVIAAIAGIAR